MNGWTSRASDLVVTNHHGRGEHIPILDEWRAVAIILVLLFHGLMKSDVNGNLIVHAVAAVSGRTVALGFLIFFCISGYLITRRRRDESRIHGTLSMVCVAALAIDFYPVVAQSFRRLGSNLGLLSLFLL
jgi:surface polysaccharide O-acyltransferase-like enzyme